MNTIMVIVLKVLFPYGLSLSYILIHSVIFRNEPTDVSNLGKRVSVPCRVPPLLSRRGLGRINNILGYYHNILRGTIITYWGYYLILP